MKNTTFKLAAVAIAAASALAGQAYAAGFMLTEQSVAGLGRSYAGIGVDGTDISGVYYNPATMTLHKGTILQAGFVGIGLNLDYAGTGNDNTTENGREKSQAIPHGYLLHQINDSTWFGLAMTVPFGMGTEFGDDWSQADHGISAQILTFDFNPNVAWKASEKLSFGAGVSVQYASADLTKKTYLADTAEGKKNGGSAVFGLSSVRSEIDADSIAWGWNVGMMWSPLENLRFGLSYRSKVKHDADGDLTIDEASLDTTAPITGKAPNDTALAGMLGQLGVYGELPGSAVVSAPAWAMATVAWDVNNLLSLYGTFRWTDWSSFDKLDIKSNGAPMTTIQNNWRDTYLTSLGADLRVTDRWTLRGGVAYETSPIATKEYRTAIIPDADRWWFSVGSSYKISENMIADVGFAHLHGVHERSLYDANGQEVGKFRKLDAYLLGAQLQYKF